MEPADDIIAETKDAQDKVDMPGQHKISENENHQNQQALESEIISYHITH